LPIVPTDREAHRTIATNRKARHRFQILEELECGVALVGTEVKSLRAGRCSIGEGWARIKKGELWLVGVHIPEYSHGNRQNHEPERDRKLLVHRRELRKLDKRLREKGLTLVPLEIYFVGPRVKCRIGLVKGKKMHDKREDQKRRDASREIDRALSRRR